MIHRYNNNYKREHSIYLNDLFDISPNGVDYYNPYDLGFEFKESFIEKREKIFYKVPEHQTLVSDFFIFCLHTSEYYLVRKEDIEKRFDFKTKEHNANIRINTVKSLSIYNIDDVNKLKEYIDKIRRA